ncbi:hypothetical protein BHE74_00034865 [Ensete ventricosum]|nr:hypothetical protein GW17_00023117 [Ensete ventricosum]RWW58294.1 hypothetical protein BHE74_00034865 [Ensete ventricosum]RZS10443.1 hypothetical protein BHM03_00041679 [Ensete ventricosum]
MQLGTRLECVGSSSRVSGACHDERRLRLIGRLSGVAERLAGNDGPRSSLGIKPSSDDVVGHRREFARRFTEGIGKFTGNTKRDHQKTHRKNVESCRIGGINHLSAAVGPLVPWKQGSCQRLSAAELPGQQVNHPYLVFGRLTTGKPPKLGD